MNQHTYDAVIIGGGAAGLSSAQALGRSLRRTLVIDSGSPRNRFAAHMHNVLGHDGTPPHELLERGWAEASAYGVERLTAEVAAVREAPAGLEIVLAADVETTASGAAATGTGTRNLGAAQSAPIRTRALIVATGVRDDLPGIPGLAEHWGTGVLHCPYCHGWEVRGKRLAVLATSPMSLHQARLLRQWSDELTVFGAALGELDARTLAEFAARGVLLVRDPVAEVVGAGGQLTHIRTAQGSSYEIDAIFTAPKLVPHDAFLAGLDLARSETPFGAFLEVDPAGRTSHPRVWAAGNVAHPMASVPGAMAEGAMAGGAVNFALVEEDFADAADPHRFWERQYSGAPRVWSGRVNEALATLTADLPPGRSLDLGCGEGGDVLWLAARGWEATGVDLSETAVARARADAEARGLNAHVVAADLATWLETALADHAEQSAQAGTHYDLVTASFLQSPVEFPRADVLRKAAKLVAPGGRIVVLAHGAPPSWAAGGAEAENGAGVGAGPASQPGAGAVAGHAGHRKHWRGVPHSFPTPEEELAALALDPADWHIEVAEQRPRPATSPDGEPGTHTDTVIVAVRR